MIAGRPFTDRDALEAHILIVEENCKDGVMVGPEDSFFLFHLATFHPNFLEKMTAPVVGFKYGPHPEFQQSKSFFIIRADGTEESLNAKKCIEVAWPNRGRKRGRDYRSAGAAAGGRHFNGRFSMKPPNSDFKNGYQNLTPELNLASQRNQISFRSQILVAIF